MKNKRLTFTPSCVLCPCAYSVSDSFGHVLRRGKPRRCRVVPGYSNEPSRWFTLTGYAHPAGRTFSSTISAGKARRSYPVSIRPRSLSVLPSSSRRVKESAGRIAPSPLDCCSSHRPARIGQARTWHVSGRGWQNRSDTRLHTRADAIERITACPTGGLLSSLTSHHPTLSQSTERN
jgi:hypothetical protein